MQAVVTRLPPPPGDPSAPLRARLIDSWYDETRGVVCLVSVADGCLREGDRIAAVTLGPTAHCYLFILFYWRPLERPLD